MITSSSKPMYWLLTEYKLRLIRSTQSDLTRTGTQVVAVNRSAGNGLRTATSF